MIITKQIEWDMGHRITNHRSKCRNIHGHRYKLEVCLKGKVNTSRGSSNEGMILDFYDVKKLLIKIHDICDHAFMVWEKDKLMIDFFKKNNEFKIVVLSFVPTVENIAAWLYKRLEKEIKILYKTKIKLDSVTVWETPTSKAYYSSDDFISDYQ